MILHMEYQAVILAAGEGSKLYPITEEIPKALLPVGNRPMIWYPLHALKQFGFQDVIIVTRHSDREKILNAVKLHYGHKLNCSIVTIADDADDGTVESLRQIKDKIKTDVFVISCDMISDVSLHRLADVHRTNDASLTALLGKHVDFSLAPEGTQRKSGKKEKADSQDFVAIEPQNGRILFIENDAESGADYSTLNLRKTLLKRYPNLLLRNDLRDCHCYIFKPWVISYIAESKLLDSIRCDLVPHLVRKQFSKPKAAPEIPDQLDGTLLQSDVIPNIDLLTLANENQVTSSARDWSANPLPASGENVIRCHALVYEGQSCHRIKALPSYLYSNRQASKVLSLMSDSNEIVPVHPLAVVKEKSQIGSDSFVGESVSIAEGVSIKRSVIGNHCKIGAKVKITNSVIMDHVQINDGCVISNSIICNEVYICDECNIKDSQLGTGYSYTVKGDLRGEILTRESIGFDS